MTSSILATALLSVLQPVSWQEIELNQKLVLNTPITLTEKLTLASGTNVKVTDILPLDQINVLAITVNLTPCKASMKNETSDMVLVQEIYGAKLEKSCKLNLFLELSDLHQPSVLSTL